MIVSPIIDLSNEVNEQFMKQFDFSVDGKIIKSGKLKLFVQRGVFMEFHLIIKESIKVLEIPYPFKLERTKNGYEFDYRIKSMFLPIRKADIKDMVDENCKPLPFYDKILTIKIS